MTQVPIRRSRISLRWIAAVVVGVVGVSTAVLPVRGVPRFLRSGVPDAQVVSAEMQRVAAGWRLEHAGRCPTVEQLLSDRWLDSELCLLQACRSTCAIQCTGNAVTVVCPKPNQEE